MSSNKLSTRNVWSSLRFDLARGDLASLDGLETVLTEADLAASRRQAAIATLELLAKFSSFRL